MGDYYTHYPLLGQIEMLATRAAFCEVSTLNTLSNELKDTTKVSEYDELGMLQKVVIRKGDSDILTNTMTYKKRSTSSIYISKFIEKETIKYGSTTVNRSYGIDALGNVTSLSDTTFGSHSYTYNARGFLTKEDSTEYNYDDNGNIIKAGTTTFTYDTTIKDKLKSVNGKEITYGTNPLNPASWNGLSYTFEGRRLTRYTYGGGYYSFEYNDQGLRTAKKDYRGVGSKYYYDGDKLITEVASSYRLDFLYDENEQLYGFIKDNTDKYFYVRDFMQNVLGIIDKSGSLVVKYDYTAYGTIKSITGTLSSTIGNENPFRYKGYYYDKETFMYYCKSRYYVPEWCRWLNGDSTEYLKPENINGMNLFSYCQNNPVILVDETGNWGWRDILGKIAGIVLSAAITTVAITLGVATGGVAGILIAGAIGFAAGFTSSVVEQGIAKGEIDFSRAALEGVISGVCAAATAGAINASGIMTQRGFIERAIETCTSDLFNQVNKLASFTLGALRIGYTAFKF